MNGKMKDMMKILKKMVYKHRKSNDDTLCLSCSDSMDLAKFVYCWQKKLMGKRIEGDPLRFIKLTREGALDELMIGGARVSWFHKTTTSFMRTPTLMTLLNC